MRRDLRLKLEVLRRKMASALSPLPPDLRDQRLAESASDDDAFARYYLPFWCEQATPEFHTHLSAGFALRGNEIQCYAAPRGFAKSTRSLIHVARSLCHAQRKSIMALSASETIVEELVTPLFIALTENQRIAQDFGQVVKKGNAGDFWTVQDARFRAKGRDERKRGPRLDLAWIDDIEDAQQARSKDQTDKVLDILLEEVYPMLHPSTAGGGTFVMVGTVLSRKSALARLLNVTSAAEPEFPDVLGLVWRAIMTDDRGHEQSLWPERFPLEELRRIRNRIGKRRFMKEYMNSPQDDDSVFTNIQGFHEAEFFERVNAAA